MKKKTKSLPAHIEQINPQILERAAEMFLAIPIFVFVIMGGI